MVELRWIKTASFLMLVLQFTAVTGEFSSSIVRGGDTVILSCENVVDGQDNCDDITWISNDSGRQVELVNCGKLGESHKAKSGRLSVTESCSLVIKKVTWEDVGLYHCQQLKSNADIQVHLSIILIREDEDGKLSCSLKTSGTGVHKVKCIYMDGNADGDIKYSHSEPSECSVTFPTYLKKSKYRELFECEVTDGYTQQVQRFSFNPQSSDEIPDEDATTATTPLRTIESSTKSRTNSVTSTSWWLYVTVSVGLAALLIIIVAIIRWKRTKGSRPQMDDNTGQSLNPAVTHPGPETHQDTGEPENDVAYASVSYTKKTNSKAQVQVINDADDEGDSVTYSTVKVSSSSAGASADPSGVFATVNKPNK